MNRQSRKLPFGESHDFSRVEDVESIRHRVREMGATVVTPKQGRRQDEP